LAGPGAAATPPQAGGVEARTVLFEAGDKIDRVYFPHSGIISLVVELAGGETVEAAMIGRWRRRSSANGCGASAC
jgi:CRP-like cAMP-binding protein